MEDLIYFKHCRENESLDLANEKGTACGMMM
jgi:hypothetical protein